MVRNVFSGCPVRVPRVLVVVGIISFSLTAADVFKRVPSNIFLSDKESTFQIEQRPSRQPLRCSGDAPLRTHGVGDRAACLEAVGSRNQSELFGFSVRGRAPTGSEPLFPASP